MKKLLSFLLALTLSFSLATFALADNEGGAAQFDPRLTITEKRDTIIVNVCETKENAEILAEKQPTLTVACGYARAVVTDPNGMQIEAALKDGKISFVVATVGNYTIKRVSASASKPAAGSSKTDEPSRDDAAPAETYPDVKKSDWHYEAVQFVTEEKLMTGTGKGFEPDAATTRAMLWTILARMDGAEMNGGTARGTLLRSSGRKRPEYPTAPARTGRSRASSWQRCFTATQKSAEWSRRTRRQTSVRLPMARPSALTRPRRCAGPSGRASSTVWTAS